MGPEEDRQLSNSKTTSKTRAQQPATRSSFDPIEDIRIQILDPKKGDPIVKELENIKTQVKPSFCEGTTKQGFRKSLRSDRVRMQTRKLDP